MRRRSHENYCIASEETEKKKIMQKKKVWDWKNITHAHSALDSLPDAAEGHDPHEGGDKDDEGSSFGSTTITSSVGTADWELGNLESSVHRYNGVYISWNPSDRYEVVSSLGSGKYSHVFLAYDTVMDKMVVAKVLKPVEKENVFREYAMLMKLKGGPNVIGLLDVVRGPRTCRGIFIFEYVESIDFRVLQLHSSDADIRYYVYELLTTLAYAHSLGVMHRDVKQSNLCINHKEHILKLIDWGMAENVYPQTVYSHRVGTRFFKAPELLLHLSYYDHRVDMWSVGCILGSWMFKMEPLFNGGAGNAAAGDDVQQLMSLMQVFGYESWKEYASQYKSRLPSSSSSFLLQSLHRCPPQKKPWRSFVNHRNQHLCPSEALDLLDKLLQLDYLKRIQAKDALNHAYFDSVRSHPLSSPDQ